MMKKGYFRNFEIEDNGKSLSTFVMQLSAPLHVLHKRMKCESFIFLFTHHSYLQTVMYWSMETLMITRLKCSLNPESSHCLTFQLSPIRSLNCLSVKTCLSFIFLITDNMLHYFIQKVMFQLFLQRSLNCLSVKTWYKKSYAQKVMYLSTDNNNDVEMLFESRKLLLLNISNPSQLQSELSGCQNMLQQKAKKKSFRVKQNTPKKNEILATSRCPIRQQHYYYLIK